MKRVLMGVLWFVVIFVVLYFGASLATGFYMRTKVPADATAQQAYDATQQFMLQHAPAVAAAFWGIVLLAVALAVAGTVKGVLPGTKKPQA